MDKIQKYWKTIGVIAVNTYKETIRDRILYALIGFSVLVVAVSLLASSISLNQDVRVTESFSLTAMLVFLVFITLFVGTQSVFKEVDRKTIYLTISKPVTRDQLYLGKYLGICLTLAVCAGIMGMVFLTLVYQQTHGASWSIILSVVFTLLEAWLLTAIGLLFSAFSTPVGSTIYTFCIALIGHSSSTIMTIANKNAGFVKYILKFVYYIFPNFEKFDLRNEVIYGVRPATTELATIILYFVAYALLVLILGMLAFRHDEF